MNLIRNLIWDFDGTLFNTYPAVVDAFKKALKDYGIKETDESILNCMKISESYAIAKMGELYGIGQEFINRYAVYKNDITPDMAEPFPYTKEVCQKIIELGGGNYILTHRGETTQKFLKHYDMIGLFTEIVTKDYGFKRKPDPEGFVYLIEKHHLDKNTTMVVGDREIEILGGKAAGIKTCLYDTNQVSFTAVPDFYITSLKDLLDIV
jgi:phosphoglycolate phosphatase-like HAD superfamily hydrolase